jgi:hypothetical protein
LRRSVFVVVVWLLAGCASAAATPTAAPTTAIPTAAPTATATPEPVEPILAPEAALPPAHVVAGWSLAEERRTYDPDTLYDFMNGAADLYFAYGFEMLAVGKYENDQGGQVRVEIYRTATDADAFGLFTYNSFGETIDLGVDGRWASGTGAAFWQRRTFVQVISRDQVEDAALQAFARAVGDALPVGGERPNVVAALPVEGQQPGSVRFFREQMALDNFLWLGTANVLGLGPDVEGALAEYVLDEQAASLLLVVFPDSKRAQDAQTGLEGAGTGNLVATAVQENALGAVLGQVDVESAISLLEKALGAIG